MPGLVGIVSLNWRDRVDNHVHENMCKAIYHMPWYKRMDVASDNGNFSISRIHHGMMNPLKGPVQHPEARITAIIDGEIYNELPAGTSQSDFILDLYISRGERFVEDLNGSFNVIILEPGHGRVTIANDRTASRPLFWFEDGKSFYFSPEIKSFLSLPTFKRKINDRAVSSFLHAGYLINRETYFENIRLLDNASVLVIQDGTIKTKNYWAYVFQEDIPDMGFDYYVRRGGDLVEAAVKRRVGKDDYAILLSGGIDSRAIIGAHDRIFPETPPVTITWGVDEHTSESDAAFARELSQIVRSRHHFFDLIPERLPEHFRDIVYLSEGLTDAAGNYPEGLNLFRKMREELGINFILRGDQCFGVGGDMVQTLDDVLPMNSMRPPASTPQYTRVMNSEKYDRLTEIYTDGLKTVLKKCTSGYLHNKKDFFRLDQRLVSYLHLLSYLKQIEIEIRNPLLDNHILDFLMETPYYHRIDKKLIRGIVKKTFPRVTSIPLASKDNDINWDSVFRQDLRIQNYIASVLIESENSFDEYLDKGRLSVFLDHYFQGGGKGSGHFNARILKRVKTGLKRYKPLISMMRKFRRPWSTENNIVVFRLLILKTWFDLFVDENN